MCSSFTWGTVSVHYLLGNPVPSREPQNEKGAHLRLPGRKQTRSAFSGSPAMGQDPKRQHMVPKSGQESATPQDRYRLGVPMKATKPLSSWGLQLGNNKSKRRQNPCLLRAPERHIIKKAAKPQLSRAPQEQRRKKETATQPLPYVVMPHTTKTQSTFCASGLSCTPSQPSHCDPQTHKASTMARQQIRVCTTSTLFLCTLGSVYSPNRVLSVLQHRQLCINNSFILCC